MAKISIACIGTLWIVIVIINKCESKKNGHRSKRQISWITFPVTLKENVDYTDREFIVKIQSDNDTQGHIEYSIRGQGATEEPKNLFTIDPKNGYIRINNILDREKQSHYTIYGMAKNMHNLSVELQEITINFTVEDQNDCPPVFKMNQAGSVHELSIKETEVMQIIATDDDEPNTQNSKIAFSILEQSPAGQMMFRLDSNTGKIYVKESNLDREIQGSYSLIVQGTDLGGSAGGMTGTGTVQIIIEDVNDNPPTLIGESCVFSVKENIDHGEIWRIKVEDLDQKYSDNWLAVFKIKSGNEAGYFTITTDPKTNEGVVMLNKAIDYEEISSFELTVEVTNKAVFYTSVSETKHNKIIVNVKNVLEGPKFHRKIYAIPVSEDRRKFTSHTVIGTYQAISEDNRMIIKNASYFKRNDPENWLIIDEHTAEIRLNKIPDRESKFIINGKYNVEILCITKDFASETATGTITLEVEDFNDHCPRLTSTIQSLCTEDQVVYVTAEDEDADPNAAPFTFSIVPEGTKCKWMVESLNGTTAILRSKTRLWPGSYQVTINVQDQQGLACPDHQVVQVDICTCNEVKTPCRDRLPKKTSTFGPAGIALLILGFVILSIVPLLLLFCVCGRDCGGICGGVCWGDCQEDHKNNFSQISTGISNLIAYHTEGPGEDNDMLKKQTSSKQELPPFNVYVGGKPRPEPINIIFRPAESNFEGIALHEAYLKNYYMMKANHFAAEECHRGTDDFLVYDKESQESPAGSVGCCSFIEEDHDLEFLNDIGTRFKSLAEICISKEVKSDILICPPISPVQPSSILTDTETTYKAVHLTTNTVVPHSVCVIQQPAFYPTTPNAQTIQYTEDPQVHNIILVSEGSSVSHLQGILKTNDVLDSGNVILKEKRMVYGPVASGSVSGVHHGALNVDPISGSQRVVVVERKVEVGQVLQAGMVWPR
ncbi:desmoglein-2.1 [Amia ocellicauda]|uniref:desmoglein-2.1 n=1 Tax=Amia ocellicauda TaxID=2972642 RepID=UPI003463E9C9